MTRSAEPCASTERTCEACGLRVFEREFVTLCQEGILFDRTLKENLLLGRPAATIKELRAGHRNCRSRRIAPETSQELGYATRTREGNALSGGERQRVALARAVLQHPSLLLLDESTSALDAPSERRIFTSLAHYFANQTIVFISHTGLRAQVGGPRCCFESGGSRRSGHARTTNRQERVVFLLARRGHASTLYSDTLFVFASDLSVCFPSV